MNLRETLKQTVASLMAHKMRSFLTMFGIIWGIASVIILIGLGQGFSKDQAEHMKSIGTDLVITWGGRTSAQAGGLAAGRVIRLNIEDARTIKREAYHIRRVSPELIKSVSQVSAYNSANRPVRGIWPEYQEFRSLKAGEGRMFTQEDEDQARRVVVLGVESRSQLYSGHPAIGQTLMVAGYPYTVVGVLEKKKQNGSYGAGPDNTQLFVPFSAMARDFPPTRPGTEPGYINDLVFEVENPEEHEVAVHQVRQLLGRNHHFDSEDRDALFFWDTMQGSKLVARIFDVMTIFFGAIAVTTLCLGGLGVMNIMLVTVTERTREIGVMKAMGATSGEIGRQFFTESAIISIISGLLGLIIGGGVSLGAAAAPRPDFLPAPLVTPGALLVSVFTLCLITLGAGMYPAQRAAQLTPVECLRQE
jgi:putative ABC transport system permease protein